MLLCFRQSTAKRRHIAAQLPVAALLCGDQDRGPALVQNAAAPDWAHRGPVIISHLAQRHRASAGELLRHPQGQSPSHSSSSLQAHNVVIHSFMRFQRSLGPTMTMGPKLVLLLLRVITSLGVQQCSGRFSDLVSLH